jgi:hypothetical protein
MARQKHKAIRDETVAELNHTTEAGSLQRKRKPASSSKSYPPRRAESDNHNHKYLIARGNVLVLPHRQRIEASLAFSLPPSQPAD